MKVKGENRFNYKEVYHREGRLQAYYEMGYITPLDDGIRFQRQELFKFIRGEIPHPHAQRIADIKEMREEYPELMARQESWHKKLPASHAVPLA